MKDESGMNKEIEQVSSEVHDIYIKEAKRQGDVRHKDKYEDLAENIKDFDRVIAKWHLRQVRIAEIKARIDEHTKVCGRPTDCPDYRELEAMLAEAEKEKA